MKNSIIKTGMCLVLVLCMAFSLSVSAFATNNGAEGTNPPADTSNVTLPSVPVTENLTYLYEVQDLRVRFEYDVEFPTISLISPDGITIPVNPANASIKMTWDTNWAVVLVPSAAAGQWQVTINKKTNTEVTYGIIKSMENIMLQYINVTPDTDGYYQIAFMAERGTENGLPVVQSYDYQITLCTEDGTKVGDLGYGWGYTAEEKTYRVYLGDYNSYDKYVIKVYVEMTRDGVLLFDEYQSAAFSYTNPNVIEAPAGLDVWVNVTERMADFSWYNYTRWQFDSYFLEISVPGQTEPIYYEEFSGSETKFNYFLKEEYSEFTVTLRGRDGNRLSEPVTRVIRLGDDSYLGILTSSPTNSNQAQIKMDIPKDCEMLVSVGEEEAKTYVSDGTENIIAVTLQNGTNNISASATVEDVHYNLDVEIFKDGSAPILSLFEPYDGKTFAEASVTLVGSAEGASKLYCGETQVELDDFGGFSVAVNLVQGENAVKFVAEDAAGNRTSRTVYLYGGENAPVATDDEAIAPIPDEGGEDDGGFDYFPLVAAFAIGLGAIALCIVLVRKGDQLKKFSFVSLICLMAVATIIAGIGLVQKLVYKSNLDEEVNSMKFSELVDKSPEQALEKLEEAKAAPDLVWAWAKYVIIFASVMTAMIIGYVIFNFVKKKMKNKPPKNKPEKKKTLPEVVAPIAEQPAEAPQEPEIEEVPQEPTEEPTSENSENEDSAE